MSCFLEKCVEEQKKICEYAQTAAQTAEQDGDDKTFCKKIKQKKSPIMGVKNFHPVLGPIFLSMFPNTDFKL